MCFALVMEFRYLVRASTHLRNPIPKSLGCGIDSIGYVFLVVDDLSLSLSVIWLFYTDGLVAFNVLWRLGSSGSDVGSSLFVEDFDRFI